MYPYRSSGYGSGMTSRSYQQQQPRAASAPASQAFDDDLPMYVMREDALQPRYAAPSERLQAHYYAVSGGGPYEESSLRAVSQRYYDEGLSLSYSDPGSKRLRTSYPAAYQDPRSARYQTHAAPSAYPQRPGEQKCSFYMRTANCSYGADCKFDHPAWVPPEGIPGWKEEEGEFPQRPGQPHCAYFMKNGACKFGSTCKFDHPGAKLMTTRLSAPPQVDRSGSRSDTFGTSAPLNSKGLPLRPAEPLCQFFRKTGDCKYGVLCKFDHPEPGSSKRKRASDDDLQDVPLYSVLPESSFPSSNSGPPARAPTAFPLRPGQPECAFYMRTGSCQYGATCKYHHPVSRSKAVETAAKAKPAKATPPAGLTPAGLPRRPGATLCAYYMKTGLCKYAPDCKFDHPPPGEAAKMAYRAAAAEKAAPAVETAAATSNAGQKAVEQAIAQVEEKVAGSEANGGGEGEKAVEKAPEEPAEEGGEGGMGGGFEGEAFEEEAWTPEPGVEIEGEEGMDTVGGENAPESGAGPEDAAIETAGVEQGMETAGNDDPPPLEAEAPAAGETVPAEVVEQEAVPAERTQVDEEAAPMQEAVIEEETVPSQGPEIGQETAPAQGAQIEEEEVVAQGAERVEQEEQTWREGEDDELDYLDAEGLEDDVDEQDEGAVENGSMHNADFDLEAHPDEDRGQQT